jgi:hypothetical protein
MSAMPECTKCGKYVNWGPVLCFDCEKKAAQKYADLLELADNMAEAIASGYTSEMIPAMQKFYAFAPKTSESIDNPSDCEY